MSFCLKPDKILHLHKIITQTLNNNALIIINIIIIRTLCVVTKGA